MTKGVLVATGVEIATAYISMVPSMRGVQGNIAKEFGAVTKIAQQTSREVGSTLSTGFQTAAKAASTVVSETAKVAGNITRGFKTGAVDGFSASLGALGKSGVTAVGSVVKALPGMSAGFEKVRDLAMAGPRMFSQFAAGFKSPTAAASTFTGVMGTLGGSARGALDGVISKTVSLGQAITAPAKNFMDGFRAMNGGVMEFSGRMGNLGATVGNFLKPVVDVGRNIGGVFKQIGGAMGPALSAVGDFARSAVEKVGEIANKIADTFRGPATAAVVAGVAAMSVALTKGLGRLNAIDTAKAKLRGLGNDADTTAAIMKNATAAVKGTAYGLDEAATTAAGAVAAGIKPGEQLENTLKTVANVAAATGRGMDDMGQVFNQVAAGGKAYTMQIKQVANAGLPIWQKLAEVLGTTEDQVQSMASSGQIDFATFQKAAQLAAGTVAEEMGQTLPGALANVSAAVSRIGANLWKGFELDDGSYTGIYSKLTDLVLAIQKALGPVEALASKVGNAVGEKLGPAFDFVTDKLNAFSASTDGIKEKFGGILSAVAPAGAAFAALGAGGLAPLLTKLPLVGGMLGPLPKMLGAIGGPAGMAAVGLLALAKVDPTQMAEGFQAIAAQLPSMIDGILGMVANLAGEIIPSLLQGLTANMPVLLDGITGMISTILQALVDALPMLVDAAITLFMGLVQALAEIMPPLLESVLALIPMIIEALMGMLPTLIDGALTLFMGLVQALTDIVPPLLEAILGMLPEILESLVSMLPPLVEGAITLFMGIVNALPVILPPLIDAVVGLIPVIVESLLSMLDVLIQGAITLFMALVDALPEIIPDLIQAVLDLGPVLVQAVLDLIPQLFQAGKDLIGGLIGGIGDLAGGAVDAIKGVGSSMIGGFKNLLGIKSPSTVFAKIGGFLDKGLADGVGKGTGSVDAVKKMASAITAITAGLQKDITRLSNVIAQQVAKIITSLRSLVQMMSGTFKTQVAGQLNAVAALFRTVLPNAVKAAMSAMRSQMQSFQTWVAGSFRNGLVSAVNAIKTAFTSLPTAINAAWGKIKAGTATPTNYVISTVYMAGIRSAVNSINSAVGIPGRMPVVSRIGYAAGGVLPGYTPGRDIYDFYSPQFGTLRLSGGEGILRPEVVKALGGAPTINAWNQARGRGVGSVGDRGYASGGILDFLKKSPLGWSVNTSPMDFQMHALDKPKDTIKQLVQNPAIEYAQRAGGGMFGAGAGKSFTDIAGGYAALFAKAVENLGGGGTGLVAAARKALGVPYVWGGSSIPPGLDCSGLVYWAYQQMGKKNVPRLTAAGYQQVALPTSQPRAGDVAFWGNPAKHIAIMTGANSIVHAPKPGDVVKNAALYGNPTFGRLKYDEGGFLPPGLTVVENRTGKPEPVFTSLEQARSMAGGVRDVYFQVDVSEVRDIAEAADVMKTLDRRIRMGVA